ncbi:MAG TPA: hypothetical protein VN894_15890 [Polyangiaceae bacterium]|nr:hypothetical protein [Polyangiaceae bacterium]
MTTSVPWHAAFVVAVLAPRLAFAQQAPPPAERGLVYSTYEDQTIDQVLAALGSAASPAGRPSKPVERDPAPEGKTIEHVDIVPLDVIERRDPLPLWVNKLHFTSRQSVIRRELLVREGVAYNQVLVDETLRNLRLLPELSVVLAVATKGSTPGRVGVVVITKDVWSLRLNWDAAVTPGGVEFFEAQPAEWNFLGTHQTLSGDFVYQPLSNTFGLGYAAPRLGTSRIAFVASADVVVNGRSGAPEGSFGSLVTGQPLYSALTPWAWDASVGWEDDIRRRYNNAKLRQFVDSATDQSVPFEYRARQFASTYEVTRSFGWDIKHDVTLAAWISRQQYRVNFPGADPRTVADFVASAVPVSDTRVGPSIQYHTHSQRYVRVIDFDTLALQEDHRLGHDIVLRVYPSFHALGATHDLLGFFGAIQYTTAVRDGIFRVAFASTTERQVDRIGNAAVEPTIYFASPTIAGLGRIVLDATLLYRWRNDLNLQNTLGGGDRLRGYPTNFFQGQNVVSYNVELRSRPVEILTCQLAGVAFFDAGDAFRSIETFTPYQSVGVGLRALFPQLDRIVFSADIGFPIERALDAYGIPIAPLGFNVSFGQAFFVPSVSPAPVLPTSQ